VIDQYLWYVNFGNPGSLNDINILNKSSIVGSMLNGLLGLRVSPYVNNGTRRDWMYFLADGIYPNWAIFVKTFTNAISNADKAFLRAAKKLLERILSVHLVF
jgi:hypothetical protein